MCVVKNIKLEQLFRSNRGNKLHFLLHLSNMFLRYTPVHKGVLFI